jgi:hypothetical protein
LPHADDLIEVKDHQLFKQSIYSMSVVVDRVLWEEWLLTYFRPVYHYWGNPEIFYGKWPKSA